MLTTVVTIEETEGRRALSGEHCWRLGCNNLVELDSSVLDQTFGICDAAH